MSHAAALSSMAPRCRRASAWCWVRSPDGVGWPDAGLLHDPRRREQDHEFGPGAQSPCGLPTPVDPDFIAAVELDLRCLSERCRDVGLAARADDHGVAGGLRREAFGQQGRAIVLPA